MNKNKYICAGRIKKKKKTAVEICNCPENAFLLLGERVKCRELLDSTRPSLRLIFLPFCVHSFLKKAEFLCYRLEEKKLRTVPPSPDTKAPGPPQLINRCVLVPSQAQPLKWQSRGPIIVKNWKLNIGFISSVIKGPWNWFNAAALLLGGFLQREHKTMSSSHLLINPPNPAKLISPHNFARN